MIYLICLVDTEKVLATLKRSSCIIFIAPVISLIGFWFASSRWKILLSSNNLIISSWYAFYGYMVGFFYGTFLPGNLGGDIFRIQLCVRQTKCKISTATSIVILERVCGVLVLFSMIFYILICPPSTLTNLTPAVNTQRMLPFAAAGIMGIILFIFGCRMGRHILQKKKFKGIFGYIQKAVLPFSTIRGGILFQALILSALFQSTDIFVSFLLSYAIHLSLSLKIFFLIIPLAYFTALLPISLGGLGVREGTLVFLLTMFGISASDAVTFSMLVCLNRFAIGGIGGALNIIETIISPK